MGRRCKNQVWDGRTNIVTVAPAEPSLTQSAETAMIISRLLIIALGILWILLLLIIGGALGVDAASVPVTGATHAAHQTLAVASTGDGGHSIVTADAGNRGDTERGALLGEAMGCHRRGELGKAAALYSTLLEVVPNDPDGMHLLGLVRYSQGTLLDKTSERRDESRALFEEAERLVKSAVSSAISSEADIFSMRRNFGEILRAKGDLEEAVRVLRDVLQEQEEAGVREHQASFNLAATLVEIIKRVDSSPRGHPLHSENLSKYLSEKHSLGRTPGSEEWELRLEAQGILLREHSRRPDDKRVMLHLAALVMSNWGVDRNGEKGSGGSQSEVVLDDDGEIRYDRDGNLMKGFSDGGVGDFVDGHEWETGGRRNWGEQAVFWFDRALALDPSDDAVALDSAAMLHRLGRTEEARVRYTQIMESAGAESGDTRIFAMSNLLVLMQDSGDYEGAIEGYRELLVQSPDNAFALNNLGVALNSVGEHEEGVAMLEKSLQLDPLTPGVMSNLGIHWQEEGDLDRARSFYARAEEVKRNDALLVRRAIMLLPVMVGEQENAQELENMATALDDLIDREPPLVIPDPSRGVERIHFYLVYRGGNLRAIQEKVARMYARVSPGLLHIAPSLETEDDYTEPPAGVVASAGGVSTASGATTTAVSTTEAGGSTEISTPVPPLRVGFVSKFFGDEEPHGMLLEGVMRHLPREHFHVTVCPINAPGRRVSPRLADAADEVVSLPTKLEIARSILGGLSLDVLVYADMNSEPVSHFLGYARLARVQAVFWGNPITSGNPSIDYFVSADVMEAQHRTAFSEDDETYSEQVVLLGGQGIWYNRLTHGASGLGDLAEGSTPEASKAALRRELKSRLGVEEDSVIFMCSQSLFKLKPDFDLVLRDILVAFDHDSDNYNKSPESTGTRRKEKAKAYIVLTGGRRKGWTEAFWSRLQGSVPEIIPQVRMLPRTSAGTEFHRLLASADVILHPFPFGGSKTSADGMALGVPVVAMEGDALPGRMAFSLYKTMGLEGSGDRGCCVAKDRDSYVQLAVRLGRDVRYREWAGDLIRQRSAALWERRDVVYEWARFISRAAGRPSPTAQEVGLVEGADLPLLPPEPFRPQQQEQPVAQHYHNQLSQLLPNQASEGGISHRRPAQEEGAQQPTPSRLSTGIPTHFPREGEISKQLPTHITPTPGRSEATLMTKRQAFDDVAETETRPAAADADADADADAAGNDRRRTTDHGQDDYSTTTDTAARDAYHGSEEGRLTDTSHLLRRFAELHREGRLEEAAATLRQALDLMESKRGQTARRKENPLQATVPPGGSSVTHEQGKAPYSSVKGPKGAQSGQAGDGGQSENGLVESAADSSAIAGVMNDLGCTLQQLWRLDEAETMLRGAIEIRPGYASAMTSLGVILQAKNQMVEAESWYREALRLSPVVQRDLALTNLVLLMRSDGDRLQEAVDLIIREASTPPLHRGGAIIATLSLLQPRPTHRQTFRKLGEGESWSKRFGRSPGIWEEVRRLRELYPASMNNLVVFLGLLEGLGGVLDALRDVAGMEPLFFPEDEQSLLPQELHPAQRDFSSTTYLDTGRGGRSAEGLGEDQDRPIGGGDGDGRDGGSGSGSGSGSGGGEEAEIRRQGQRRGELLYDRHSAHIVTQYYIPDDPSRAREIDACLLHNLRSPFVGTVHIFVDHPDVVRLDADRKDPVAAVDDSVDADGEDASSWVETSWRPPVLKGLEETLAGKARVMRLSAGGRMTFGDAIRYSNRILSDRVVLLSNSDIAFDESLARLGDPSTLDMAHKVFALAAWQSTLVSANKGDHPTRVHEGQDPLREQVMIGKPKFLPRTDSQDVWIFRPPLPSTVADATDFEMGRPRCDGRLAQVLLDAGYSVTSPSLSLVTRHVHASSSTSPHHGPSESNDSAPSSTSSRTLTYRGDTQVAGDIAFVPISDQWLF